MYVVSARHPDYPAFFQVLYCQVRSHSSLLSPVPPSPLSLLPSPAYLLTFHRAVCSLLTCKLFLTKMSSYLSYVSPFSSYASLLSPLPSGSSSPYCMLSKRSWSQQMSRVPKQLNSWTSVFQFLKLNWNRGNVEVFKIRQLRCKGKCWKATEDLKSSFERLTTTRKGPFKY